MAALAAKVPPELFKRILFFLRGQWGSYELLGWAENKRELLSCAQTCWYWARYTRPALFQTITLRSLEDLTYLLSLASSSYSILRDKSCSLLVKTLILKSAIAPDPPWLHRVFLSKTALPNIANVSLSLHGLGVPPELLRRITSVHPSLPRSVPATLSRCDTVTIRDVRLDHFEQLAAIVRSVYWLGPAEWLEPSCDKAVVPAFHFRNVSWSAYRPVAVCPRRHPYTAVDAEYVVEDCAEPWLFVRLFVTTRAWNDDIVAKRRVPIPYVDPGELAKLEGMLRCVTESAVGTPHDGDSAAPPKNCGKFIFRRGEVNTTKSGFTFSVTCSSRPACTPSVTTHISAAGLITKFVVSFDETFSQNHSSIDLNRDCAGFAWQDLDSAALAFGDRTPLVLVRLFGERDSVSVLAEGIAKKMPGLHEVGKLKFACGGPERWRFL